MIQLGMLPWSIASVGRSTGATILDSFSHPQLFIRKSTGGEACMVVGRERCYPSRSASRWSGIPMIKCPHLCWQRGCSLVTILAPQFASMHNITRSIQIHNTFIHLALLARICQDRSKCSPHVPQMVPGGKPNCPSSGKIGQLNLIPDKLPDKPAVRSPGQVDGW